MREQSQEQVNRLAAVQPAPGTYPVHQPVSTNVYAQSVTGVPEPIFLYPYMEPAPAHSAERKSRIAGSAVLLLGLTICLVIFAPLFAVPVAFLFIAWLTKLAVKGG